MAESLIAHTKCKASQIFLGSFFFRGGEGPIHELALRELGSHEWQREFLYNRSDEFLV